MKNSTNKVVPIYLCTDDSRFIFPNEPDDPSSIWLAKEITYFGLKEKPLEEIISSLLVRENESGLLVINIPLYDAIRALIFRRFSAEGFKLIKLIYPSTYSVQHNRIALFTVIISSLAFGVSLFSVIQGIEIVQNKLAVFLPIVATLFLILFGLLFLVKPTITITYNPAKFNLEMAIENYTKFISKKLHTKSETLIFYKINIAPNAKVELIKKLLEDLPRFYNALAARVGKHFRLIVNIPQKKISECGDIINENYKLLDTFTV